MCVRENGLRLLWVRERLIKSERKTASFRFDYIGRCPLDDWLLREFFLDISSR